MQLLHQQGARRQATGRDQSGWQQPQHQQRAGERLLAGRQVALLPLQLAIAHCAAAVKGSAHRLQPLAQDERLRTPPRQLSGYARNQPP